MLVLCVCASICMFSLHYRVEMVLTVLQVLRDRKEILVNK